MNIVYKVNVIFIIRFFRTFLYSLSAIFYSVDQKQIVSPYFLFLLTEPIFSLYYSHFKKCFYAGKPQVEWYGFNFNKNIFNINA